MKGALLIVGAALYYCAGCWITYQWGRMGEFDSKSDEDFWAIFFLPLVWPFLFPFFLIDLVKERSKRVVDAPSTADPDDWPPANPGKPKR